MTKIPNDIIPKDPMRNAVGGETQDWEAVSDLVAFIDRQGWWDVELVRLLKPVRAALKRKGN